MPGGGDWHMVWAKAGDHASSAKAADVRSVAIIGSSPSRGLLFQKRGEHLAFVAPSVAQLEISLAAITPKCLKDWSE